MRIYDKNYLCPAARCNVKKGLEKGYIVFSGNLIIPIKDAVYDRLGNPRCPICSSPLRRKPINRGIKRNNGYEK